MTQGASIIIQRGGAVPIPANARPGLDLAQELARLRAENDCLKAENRALRRTIEGRDQPDFIPGLELTGQTARVCALLRQMSPAVVLRDRLIGVMRGDGVTIDKQLDGVILRLRNRLVGMMEIAGLPVRRDEVIRGAFGVGYAMPERTARFLDRFFPSGGDHVARNP